MSRTVTLRSRPVSLGFVLLKSGTWHWDRIQLPPSLFIVRLCRFRISEHCRCDTDSICMHVSGWRCHPSHLSEESITSVTDFDSRLVPDRID